MYRIRLLDGAAYAATSCLQIGVIGLHRAQLGHSLHIAKGNHQAVNLSDQWQKAHVTLAI